MSTALTQHIMRRRPSKEEWLAYDTINRLVTRRPHLSEQFASHLEAADRRMIELVAIETRRKGARND